MCATALTAQAQGGRVTVKVTDAANQQPVSQAQVQVVGTTLGGLTGPEGRFTIRGVPAGVHQIRVLRVGYGEQKKPVEVANDQEATVDFAISAVAISLTPVVTTATVSSAAWSRQLRRAARRRQDRGGNADPWHRGHAELRTAGVAVQSGTQTGVGARVRIRGASSLSLSNDPIYVIDGIRMTSNQGSQQFGTGGNNASRVGDINPDEIENVEIVKGPSAATLYGTDAANGVIVITTKRGRAGAPRWNTYGEGGYLEDRNTYPYNYTMTGHSATGATASAPPRARYLVSRASARRTASASTVRSTIRPRRRSAPAIAIRSAATSPRAPRTFATSFRASAKRRPVSSPTSRSSARGREGPDPRLDQAA
jgi:TonB-dependent SusC/RagA subfamily outer membrane receptor